MENPATEIRSSTVTITREHCSRILIITLSIVLTVAAACYWSSFIYQDEHNNNNNNSIIQPLAASIKQACNNTLNPSHCFTQLTNTASSNRATSFHHLLEILLDQTISMVVTVHSRLSNLSNVHQELSSKNKNAFSDCLEMLELTLDELRQASDQVVEGLSYYHNLKTLLSAALTNENTCTDGFTESNKLRSRNQKMLKDFIHSTLDPISTTISYCLAIITSMEGQDRYSKAKSMISKTADINKFPTWIASSDRNLIEGNAEIIPNVTVANDGTGDYRLINEAVRMAPNRSTRRYIIHIKRGVYNEVVGISRDKVNIMLVGDGMSSTVITGSRNVADGFTTFTSATLTITGDKFLARDLTVVNTAGPRKRQAVAVRVTSNAAFYRCNFTSYQDTLYAHSLCQLYRECTIQGTIDFIFGNAAAVFQNCRILVRKPILGQKNMITAQGRSDPNQNTGISIQNSIISAATGFTRTDMKYYPTFLGRPWRNFSRTIVMKSYLGHMIHPQGWCKWNQYSNLDTVQYIEYRNFGPGSNTTNRVRWGGYKNDSSDEMVKQFTVVEFLLGVDDWLDTTGLPLHQRT